MAARNKIQTPAIILIGEYYRSNGLANGWPWSKVEQLCNLLKVTPFELGALVCVHPRDMKRYRSVDKIPAPIALHFAMIHDWYVQRTIGTRVVPKIPVDLIT